MNQIILPRGVTPTVPRIIMEPLGDRYLCEVLDPIKILSSMTDSGLMLPDVTVEKLGWKPCIVLQVGNGHRLETNVTVPMFYEQHDVVMVVGLAGHEILLTGRKYLIVNQVDVLGRLRLDAPPQTDTQEAPEG